jgi:3-deoxy-7-phosphoheptulonate synthase
MEPTQNLRVRETVRLSAPSAVRADLPPTESANRTVVESRRVVERILAKEDPRLLVVIGPCSIHDPKAALEYAARLNRLREELQDRLYIVMRVYFEKPRTTVGWKGLINDPHLDGSYDLEHGLRLGRRLMCEIAQMGLPIGTEFLEPIPPQYLADLVTWTAIGARTTESQTHRMMASGLSMPVGFKNGTDGSLQIAIDAMLAARSPHSFLGIDPEGYSAIIRTTGNPFGHVVLRGGNVRTNYDPESIAEAVERLRKAGLPDGLMVDCSHANSSKQHAKQEEVWASVVAQRAAGNRALTGAMVESNLEEGNQPLPSNLADLKYGVSVTDACIGWTTTERMLRHAYAELDGKL